MSETFFSLENAMKRFFFVTGRTSDEFYTDGLLKLNIEQLVHLELKKAGYRRVVFFDKNNKLYTYDDESFDLLNKKDESSSLNGTVHTSSIRRTGGLKNGKLGQIKKTSTSSVRSVDASSDVRENLEWIKGEQSGVIIKNIVNDRLHMGLKDDFFVSRTIEAYMDDKLIKTAIVINDPASFIKDFSNMFHSMTTKYERLGTDNGNIIIFIYPDERFKNVYEVDPYKEASEEQKANEIKIGCPSSMEVKNMLLYMRIHHTVKFLMKDIDKIALSLHQAMGLSGLGIKETYIRISEYAKTDSFIDDKLCYEILATKKPLSAEEQLKSLIGMQAVKDALLRYKIEDVGIMTTSGLSRIKPQHPKELPDSQMIHFIITGNPGTGKTTVAKLIGQLFYEMGYLSSGHVVETDRQGLVAGYVGQTAIKTRNKVIEALGGVLFIDEAYSLVKSEDGDSGNDFGQEAIDTLVKAMDEFKGQFSVVVAGYRNKMEAFEASNVGLARRFGDNHIHIEDYTPKEMHEILRFHAKKNGFVLSEDLEKELPNFCENWVNQAGSNWGNAGEAENLINSMILSWKNKNSYREDVPDKVLEKWHIPQNKQVYFRPLSEYRAEMIDMFNSMVGLSGVKVQIEKLRRRMKFGDLKEPGHYIFVGNPGTGKTTVARYMGHIMKSFGLLKHDEVVEYSAESLKAEYISNRVNGKFDLIIDKVVNGVLFIDEAYQLANDSVGERILDNLLTCALDHRKDLCIILAGYEENMDEMLAHNPGLRDRFVNRIVFDNYSGEELYEILIKTLEEENISFDDEYQENAKRILYKYIPIISKDNSFSNVRYIKDIFIPACKDAKNNRLIEKYGDSEIVPEENCLTGVDFDPSLLRYTTSEVKIVTSNSALEKIDKLIGFENVKSVLRELLEQGETARRENMPDLLEDLSFHWILKGNPGTGKTTVAKLVGQVYKEMGVLSKGHTVIVKRQDLVAEYVGQTAPKTQKKIDEAMGGILFIDEAYTLKPSDGRGGDFGQEAIDTILEQMSSKNGQFGVIVAGYANDMDRFINSNDGLRSRFEQEFILPDYTAEELTKIFVSMSTNKGYYPDEKLVNQLPLLFDAMIKSKIPGWANAREAEKLLRKMTTKWSKRENVRVRLNENGDKERVFECIHIPDEYMQYFKIKEEEEEKSKDLAAKKEQFQHFHMEQKDLCSQSAEFDYEIALSEDFSKQKEGTVFIRAFSDNAEGQGTGVVISDVGYVLTCEHVIHDSNNIMVKLASTSSELKVRWEPADIVWIDEELDAAILKINLGEKLALPIESRDYISRSGDSIYMMGFPFGGRLSDDLNLLSPSMFFGKVASVQKKKGLDRIDVNMEAKRGCSGGPVFSEKSGAVIGILCGSQTHGGEGLVEEVNYVLPIKYVWERIIISQNDGQQGE